MLDDVFIPNPLQIVYLKCLLGLSQAGLDEPQPDIDEGYRAELTKHGWVIPILNDKFIITKKGMERLSALCPA